MKNRRMSKDRLFKVESELYEKYGTVENVLEDMDTYYDGYNGMADFVRDVLDDSAFYHYSAADALQIYKDFAAIGEVKYYDGYLELSDDHIMWKINADIDEYEYWTLADAFLEQFEKDYNVSDVGYLGRSGRHVVCPDTWENVLRYDELVAGMEKCQQEFIDYINSNYGEYEG